MIKRFLVGAMVTTMAMAAWAQSEPSKVEINPLYISVDRGFNNAHHKHLGDYTQQLALKLSDTMATQHVSHIAVTSFVDFDHRLDNAGALGNQLAEGLMTDLQQFGFATVEHKLKRAISVQPSGDFALSRHASELAESVGVDYVLTGTLVYRPNGVVINARVISSQDQVIKASARQFIPYFVLDDLLPHG
ncbi:FlgO family outer membrane protein [Pseudoalteromonas ruthenica]|uniref:FlgO family outer membrane protein n=1 Tax=Pseudoalteromonas ruthenica TaxID=151081 RepID=UPI00110B99F6|nr:FlgO family outer membrane protein [Pseudoalteromonas ruthenica]TMO43775.1 hypothetical protein CWC24_15355 [Pseudoalteromonas ruthenica]TMO51756.1 hypothetical protein CWC23_05160 [Pseudoalteromonas ruthenica]